MKTVCRLAYREGLADTLLFDKVHIERGDKKAPKALDKEALDKLKALRFDELEKEMETARDVFLFACYTGAAYCDLMELSKKHLVRDDAGSLWLKFNRQKTGVLCRIKLLPEAVRLIEKMHSYERETLLPFIKYPTYQSCLKALRLRAGISFLFTSHTARHREFYKHKIINRLNCLSMKVGSDMETSDLLYFTFFCHFKEPLCLLQR